MRTSCGPGIANTAVVLYTKLGLSTFHTDERGALKLHPSLSNYWHLMVRLGEVAFFSSVITQNLPFFH